MSSNKFFEYACFLLFVLLTVEVNSEGKQIFIQSFSTNDMYKGMCNVIIFWYFRIPFLLYDIIYYLLQLLPPSLQSWCYRYYCIIKIFWFFLAIFQVIYKYGYTVFCVTCWSNWILVNKFSLLYMIYFFYLITLKIIAIWLLEK